MNSNVFDFRQFQTVRDNVRVAGLSHAPLFAQLRDAQRQGDRGLAVVATSQNLRRQFLDEFGSPKGAA